MSVKTIFKGKHRCWPPTFGLFYKKEHISRLVKFEDSCRYKFQDQDQEDVNKLFGIGYFWSHHKESARFGWRYNPMIDKITLSAYCYVNSERIIWDLCSVKINEWYSLTIIIRENDYQFLVYANGMQIEHEIVTKQHKKKFGYPLSVFFGGNNPAPHKMKIHIEKS
jgi:hypothetical protein